MADHAREREPADNWIGHPRLAELSDVGGDPVQLVERPAPTLRTGTPGGDQEGVDIEEDRLWSIHPLHTTSWRLASKCGSTSGLNVAQTGVLSELGMVKPRT